MRTTWNGRDVVIGKHTKRCAVCNVPIRGQRRVTCSAACYAARKRQQDCRRKTDERVGGKRAREGKLYARQLVKSKDYFSPPLKFVGGSKHQAMKEHARQLQKEIDALCKQPLNT